jgi:serine/threonine protein kinase
MSISIPELIQNLAESGLMSLEEITKIHESLRSLELRTADEFAKELVKLEHLTKLQAAAVLKGKTKNLVFGEYVVLEKVGSGGMGQVFRAKHKQSGKIVALKVLSADAVKNRRLIERFKKEAKAASRLKHPNVVRAYEAGKINRIRYLVMEYVDGENMLERVKRKGPLPIDEVIHCVLHAARGLEYAHGKNIIHRDIKPSNLLRDKRNGRIKVLDMGLARVDDGEEEDEDAIRLTIPGQMLGTARFMAPEQIEDARKSDIPSDVYSLACTMYYLLRGKAPYSGETIAHTLMAHVSAPVPNLCKKRKDVPAWLGEIFTKMMAKSPDDRYQTMGDLVIAVQDNLGADMHSGGQHVLVEDEPQSSDEFSKILKGEQNDEGSSLAELYTESPKHESEPESEKFAEATPALVNETADSPNDADEVNLADEEIPDFEEPKPRFTFTSRATDDEEVDLNNVDLEEDEPEQVENTGESETDGPDAPDGEVLMAQTADFQIADEEDSPQVQRFSDEVAGAQEFQFSADELEAERNIGVRDYVSEKLTDRKLREQRANRRLQIGSLAVVGIIAIAVAVYFLTQ